VPLPDYFWEEDAPSGPLMRADWEEGLLYVEIISQKMLDSYAVPDLWDSDKQWAMSVSFLGANSEGEGVISLINTRSSPCRTGHPKRRVWGGDPRHFDTTDVTRNFYKSYPVGDGDLVWLFRHWSLEHHSEPTPSAALWWHKTKNTFYFNGVQTTEAYRVLHALGRAHRCED